MSATREQFFQHQQNVPRADTAALFTLTREEDKLRVRNGHVNCLYSNLTPMRFDQAYNRFLSLGRLGNRAAAERK